MTRRTKKALSMKLIDEATMTVRYVHLFNVVFTHRNGISTLDAQVYAPSEADVMKIASRLYAHKGMFGEVISFTKAI